ncbi:hypothetical protein AVEN_216742-1 [Araneus ventricosus]|uniref:Uncharacterized protein n=1 Tax=Araneus ventricosus TaxID=182803 RepID=A0A4Y2UAM7_ARAVE|nr:hypothetical protein AVEN_216742-1 [Araneus ventricosus]
MAPNKISPDELKQHFLSLISLREKKALVDWLSKKIKDLGKDNQPPDHIEQRSLDFEDLVKMLGDGLRKAAKYPSDTNTPKKNSKPASPVKSPIQSSCIIISKAECPTFRD